MRLLASAAMALSLLPAREPAGLTMTFDEALRLAAERSSGSVAAAPLRLEIADLRRARLPNVRAEVAGNTSRTLDLFSEGPLQVRYASSVLAFDYPLWDGGATSARITTLESKLRRINDDRAIDDVRFNELLDAFGDLYLAQRQSEVLRPLYDRFSAEQQRTQKLLSSGEISNLAAADRREIVLGFESRLLEVEARRIDALMKIRLLTGIETEPRVVVDLSEPSPAGGRGWREAPGQGPAVSDDSVKATSFALEESRARLRQVQASAGFRAVLSGFAGIGTAQSEFRQVASEGSFGIYGIRVLFSYPLFRGNNALALAEAQADVQQSMHAQAAAVNTARLRADEYRFREMTAERRIALLQQSVETAKEREESLQRLVAAGVRPEGDLAQAEAERIRREIDLLTVQIERWKAVRLLARVTAAGRKDDRG